MTMLMTPARALDDTGHDERSPQHSTVIKYMYDYMCTSTYAHLMHVHMQDACTCTCSDQCFQCQMNSPYQDIVFDREAVLE
jgi:hypothetical protein